MKRLEVLIAILTIFLAAETVRAQETTQPPALEALQVSELQTIQTPFGPAQVTRGGTGRGAPPNTAGSNNVVWSARNASDGAWWTNGALVSRLGLSDDQKAKIQATFENHRQSLASDTVALDKEEARLNTLLATDPVDKNAVYSQIDRVVQARGELERSNSIMTLEMREVLTKDQWGQLSGPATSVASPTSNSALMRIGGNVAKANLIPSSAVQPLYPPLAAQARIQGVVILEAQISKDGRVESLKLISGHPLLVQAAIDAVKRWRYQPFMLNGEPAAVITTITVNIP